MSIEFPVEITCTDGEPWTVWNWHDIYEDAREVVREYVQDFAADYTDNPYPGVEIPDGEYEFDPELESALMDAWYSWVEPATDRIMADLWRDYDEDDPMSWRFTFGEKPHRVTIRFA